jgi:hypothetical protein
MASAAPGHPAGHLQPEASEPTRDQIGCIAAQGLDGSFFQCAGARQSQHLALTSAIHDLALAIGCEKLPLQLLGARDATGLRIEIDQARQQISVLLESHAR